MTTEACVNTANRVDPYFRRIKSFVYWCLLCFLFIPTVFYVFFIKNHVFPEIPCEFRVVPEFREICPYRGKPGALALCFHVLERFCRVWLKKKSGILLNPPHKPVLEL